MREIYGLYGRYVYVPSEKKISCVISFGPYKTNFTTGPVSEFLPVFGTSGGETGLELAYEHDGGGGGNDDDDDYDYDVRSVRQITYKLPESRFTAAMYDPRKSVKP